MFVQETVCDKFFFLLFAENLPGCRIPLPDLCANGSRSDGFHFTTFQTFLDVEVV